MPPQPSNSHPPQSEALRVIAPRTEPLEIQIEIPKKRMRDDSEEVPKPKKLRKLPNCAWCPLCHRGFTSISWRNKHIGKDICWRYAVRRGLIQESIPTEQRDIIAAEKRTAFSSNKLVHLKDSDDRFEAEESRGVTPAGAHENAVDATVASSATNSETAFRPQYAQHAWSSAIALAPEYAVPASGRLGTQQPRPMGLQRAASYHTASQHQQYRSAFERVMSGPMPTLSRSPSMPQPRLQTSASFAGVPTWVAGGQPAFSAHQPSQPIAGTRGEFGVTSQARNPYQARALPSALAGPSRISSSTDVYARSGTPPQLARAPQAQVGYVIPNPYARADTGGQLYRYPLNIWPLPPHPHTFPSTPAQMSHSQPLSRVEPTPGNTASASEVVYPRVVVERSTPAPVDVDDSTAASVDVDDSTLAPVDIDDSMSAPVDVDDSTLAPADHTSDVSGPGLGGPIRAPTFRPAQSDADADVIEPQGESWLDKQMAELAALCSRPEAFSLEGILDGYTAPAEVELSSEVDPSSDEFFEALLRQAASISEPAPTPLHSGSTHSDIAADADAEEQPVSHEEAMETLEALATGTYWAAPTPASPPDASPSASASGASTESTAGPDTPSDTLEEIASEKDGAPFGGIYMPENRTRPWLL
ncbi:hypothetical protein K438DRAFT_1964093 [Mycena galopus ATCC 62051]|nr:hypothetical protein K438DRAFT_1964093 [Mycena galopus ATCC 62051]